MRVQYNNYNVWESLNCLDLIRIIIQKRPRQHYYSHNICKSEIKVNVSQFIGYDDFVRVLCARPVLSSPLCKVHNALSAINTCSNEIVY